MANSVPFLLLFPLIFFINFSLAQRPIFPNSIVLPVSKDSSTLQYVAQIYMGSPLAPTKLVLDLGGQFLWVDCAANSLSSPPNFIQCSSLQCSMANPDGCSSVHGLENKICSLQPENSIRNVISSGDLTEDAVAVKFRDGSHTGGLVTIHHFLYSCAPKMLLDGLAGGVKGMLGLGNSRISLPSQLSTRFGFQRKFALCLSSSNGVVLAGDGPYESISGTDISRSLMYTPLVTNQIGSTSEEYYINVKSIKINGVKLLVNSSLLSLDEEGYGGTKISTIEPYTTLKSSIYETFVKSYVEIAASMNMVRVSPVSPFDVCFSSKGVENVPILDFVLQSDMVKWRIHGRNSLVKVSDEVLCLGFLNGGMHQKASILMGGYQLEENLLEFNLGTSMLGFASMGQKKCSDFSLQSMSVD